MGGRWNLLGSHMHKVLWVVLMLHLQTNECAALNLEGMALLKFRSRVMVDPYGTFENWDSNDGNPCNWTGVRCIDGKVAILNLKELSLGGMLGPELGELSHLRDIVLNKNNFSGVIPKEIGRLTMLEILDLRDNNLSGTIPTEIGKLLSLKAILLSNNKFQGGAPSWIKKLNMLSERKFGRNISLNLIAGVDCINRKVGHCIWQNGVQQLYKVDSFMISLKDKLVQLVGVFPMINLEKSFSVGHEERNGFSEPFIITNVQQTENFIRRRLLEDTSNLPAATVSSSPITVVAVPSTGSGSFPASPNGSKKPFQNMTTPTDLLPSSSIPQTFSGANATNSSSNGHSLSEKLGKWAYLLVFPGVVLPIIIIAILLVMCRCKGVAPVGPWRTGLSGELQKAFIGGLPKLNRQELEAASEDFSNIIITYPEYTVFKGTLSSGVEIAILSTVIRSMKDWSKHAERHFRRKIDMLSRINHKNFVNLLGYCEENEPFMRMMVHEYAPNGTLHDHLHDKDFEHLDWSARMRIIMGTAYCLQYMHHELNPPISHPDLQSGSVLVTDDYAAKVLDASIWSEVKRKGLGDYDMDPSNSSYFDPGSNVYSFGILLLEIISGKLPYYKEQGSLLNWAADCISDKSSIKKRVDPTLKLFKDNELEVICEVILECIHDDPKQRPTMKSVTTKLRDVLQISPQAANPRLSPLWWAELEILSMEAS